MFSKRKKVYHISYFLNREAKSFKITFQEIGKEKKYNATFFQNKVVEEGKEVLMRFFLYRWLSDFYQVQVKNREFPAEIQYAVHEVFPYMTKCINVKEFAGLYTAYNKKFLYTDFEEIRQTCQKIRESVLYPADGNWSCIKGWRERSK